MTDKEISLLRNHCFLFYSYDRASQFEDFGCFFTAFNPVVREIEHLTFEIVAVASKDPKAFDKNVRKTAKKIEKLLAKQNDYDENDYNFLLWDAIEELATYERQHLFAQLFV